MQKILLKGSNLEKENNLGFDKLNFLTAGMPLRTGKGSYKEAFAIIEEMNLDGMELEFVHGLRISENSKQIVKQIQSEKKFVLTCHAPFYINLNSKEPEKIAASIERIVETANMIAPAVFTCIPGVIPVIVPIPTPNKHAITNSNIAIN